MNCGIYLIINTASSKVYVGSARDFQGRWRLHLTELNAGRHANGYLQRAWEKYGACSFVFMVVELCEEVRLLDREDSWIAALNRMERSKGYNLVSAARHRTSDETRQKISQSGKGRIHSPEALAKLSASKMGHEVSEDTRAKLSVAHSGKKRQPLSPEHRAKIAAAMRGRRKSEEARAAMSAARKGKPGSFTGKTHSLESRAKMAENHRTGTASRVSLA
jgi:group I intron endonuclease